ncbi:hypothetical protein MHYP_G00019860 [Metynnis hypsauchen]
MPLTSLYLFFSSTEFHAGRVPAETQKERKRRASDSSDHRPNEPEKPGRRWSYEMLPPEL